MVMICQVEINGLVPIFHLTLVLRKDPSEGLCGNFIALTPSPDQRQKIFNKFVEIFEEKKDFYLKNLSEMK